MTSMSVRIFVDTNVLVYARDMRDKTKHKMAHEWLKFLWQSRRGRISVQVIQEYYVTVTQKLKPGLPKEAAREEIQDLFEWTPVLIDAAILHDAFRIQDKHGLSWWDSQIVAAAKAADCRYLLSEDFSTGLAGEDLEVISPFRATPPNLEG